MAKLERHEVAPTLVLFLDPELLLANGARHTGGDAGRARGKHPFVCISVKGRDTEWVALSSKPARGRVPVPRHAKRGHPDWLSTPTFADLHQVWNVDLDVVRFVAAVSDRSARGARNHAGIHCLYAAAA